MENNQTHCFWIVLLVLTLVLTTTKPSHAVEQFHFTSYTDIERLFEEKGYTPESWRKGNREVPRIYLTAMPRKWRDKYSDKITVKVKKLLFFRLLEPEVLHCNERILAERERLQDIVGQDFHEKSDQQWLIALALKYRVVDAKATTLSKGRIRELLRRVDIIPPSLALAQGANESGWGTSRFARAGNALFGQWTWGGEGIASKGKQKGKGNYKVAAFEEPMDSIAAYMRNLNTNSAYASFREERATIRNRGENPTGLALVDTMKHYSQRGDAYVVDLRSIITHNNLARADDAFLGEEPIIELVPAETH